MDNPTALCYDKRAGIKPHSLCELCALCGKKALQMAEDEQPSLLEFPCDFPLKIIGIQQPGYAQTILSVVHQHAPDYDGATMEMRPSSKGKYLSLTCTIRAQSRVQLDALYQALCDHPMVVRVL